MKNLLQITILLIFSTSVFAGDYPMCKFVGSKWSWFSDHVVSTIEYYLSVQPGGEVMAGTGMKIFGKPRGSIYTIRGEKTIVAWGAGALHVKSSNEIPVKVCVNSREAVPIRIIDEEF